MSNKSVDPNNAFLVELVCGIFGFLGIGYLWAGRTSDGFLRLIAWWIYNIIAYLIIAALISVVIGCACLPFQFIIQVLVPFRSATGLKESLLAES